MPGRTSRQDPLKNYAYLVDIPGFNRIGFTEVTGLKETTAVHEYREGGDANTARKSAGLTSYENITLKRGVIIDPDGQGENDLYVWRLQVMSALAGQNADFDYRRDFSIIQMARDGTEAIRWIVLTAWPSEYTPFGDLEGLGTADSVEEIVIVNEGVFKEGGPLPPTIGQSLSPGLGIG